MNIRTVTVEQLTSEEIAAWSTIQRSEPAFRSPYFRPEFTQIVAGLRSSVEVAVLEENGRPVGFFPFERQRWNCGMPVGTWLSDYHGVIAGRDVELDPVELLRGCGLSSWHFDHLSIAHDSFAKFVIRYADSPQIDLSAGFESYEKSLPKRFCSDLKRRQRKLEREVGPLRFEPDVRDPTVFSTLIDWKTEQYKRYYAPDRLNIRWVRELLETILERKGQEFSAVMPALYYGDRLVSIDYLLRSGNVLHSWFPAFDRDAYQYSPGMLLTMEVFKAAPLYGIDLVDFGKGEEPYKRIFQNSVTRIAEGAIDRSRLRLAARTAWVATRERIRHSPLLRPAKVPVRVARHVKHWLGGYG